MPLYSSEQNISGDIKNIIYSTNIMSRRNELIRRLLFGLADSELENLVRVREEARHIPAPRRQREARSIPAPRRPVPAPRKMGVKQ